MICINMARRPAGDERSVVPDLDVPRRGERIWLRELSLYLKFPYPALRQWAKARNLLHKRWIPPGHKPIWYVTPATALRLIVFARAKQGEALMAGQDSVRERERLLRKNHRWRARKAARGAAERAIMERTGVDLCIAIPGADTEDESRGGEGV